VCSNVKTEDHLFLRVFVFVRVAGLVQLVAVTHLVYTGWPKKWGYFLLFTSLKRLNLNQFTRFLVKLASFIGLLIYFPVTVTLICCHNFSKSNRWYFRVVFKLIIRHVTPRLTRVLKVNAFIKCAVNYTNNTNYLSVLKMWLIKVALDFVPSIASQLTS